MDEPLNRDSVSFVLGCEGSFRVGLEGRPCPWLVTVTPELSRALQESFSSVLKVVFPTSSGRFLRLPLNRFRTLLGNRSTIYEPLKSGSDGKASVCNAGDPVLIPGLERSPGEGNGSPLQYSCLENPMNLGAWQFTVHGVAKSRTRLHLHFHFHKLTAMHRSDSWQVKELSSSPLLLRSGESDPAGENAVGLLADTSADLGSIPGLRRSPGEGKGCPLQYSGLENSMDCIVHEVAKSQTRRATFTSLPLPRAQRLRLSFILRGLFDMNFIMDIIFIYLTVRLTC